jgi:hypothetical protein
MASLIYLILVACVHAPHCDRAHWLPSLTACQTYAARLHAQGVRTSACLATRAVDRPPG